MKLDIRPKNVLIIGGASGIGYATAQFLLNCGVRSVILAGRSAEKLQKAEKSLVKSEADQTVLTSQFDIASVDTHIELLNSIHSRLGVFPDGLVISSGVNFSSASWKGFNISEKDYDRVMDINLKGLFFLIRNYSNFMYERNLRANICAVSSISAHRDMQSVYQISKNALSGLVHAYGKHLAKRGIILNGVEPGSTDTGMMPHLKKYTDGRREGEIWTDNGIQRVIRPEEIAEVVGYLMSENCDVLAGTCLLAGGGCRSIPRGN